MPIPRYWLSACLIPAATIAAIASLPQVWRSDRLVAQLAPVTPAPTPTAQPAPPPTPQPSPQEILQAGEVRSLPGQLDAAPMFNSNSPEWIKSSGILLSTFVPQGKATPAAHLNYGFQGDFTVFAHHFTHTPKDLQTLYLGILVHNPGSQPITLKIPAAASYLLDPDAPFQNKPPMLENPRGEIFSGPGIRAVDDVLRERRQPDFPATLTLPAGGYRLLLNHPIRTKGLARPVNGRSTFLRLNSSGKVHVASLALFAPKDAAGNERQPTLQEWRSLLDRGGFAGPREKQPTPPEQTSGSLIYGRVAGVQQGSVWRATLTDPGKPTLTLPQGDRSLSYALSTLRGGRLGTNQSQAAKLLVRYPDTAYESHGNYAVHYDLTLPLINPSNQAKTVALTLATPRKEDKLAQPGLRFRRPPQDFPFFRGTVRLRYSDDQGKPVTRYIHLWHRVAQVVEPLLTLRVPPQGQRSVRVDFLYPPDATPPQVLTLTAR